MEQEGHTGTQSPLLPLLSSSVPSAANGITRYVIVRSACYRKNKMICFMRTVGAVGSDMTDSHRTTRWWPMATTTKKVQREINNTVLTLAVCSCSIPWLTLKRLPKSAGPSITISTLEKNRWWSLVNTCKSKWSLKNKYWSWSASECSFYGCVVFLCDISSSSHQVFHSLCPLLRPREI